MKIFGKILSVFLVLIILSFSIFSVFGYSYYIGDNEKVVMKGANDLKVSTDLDGGVKISLAPATDDETDAVIDIIERRTAAIGLVDYSIYVQDSTGYINFILPGDVVHDYDTTELISFLTCTGYVTIRPDNKYQTMIVDSSSSAAFFGLDDITADSIIMNSDYIDSSSCYEYKEDGETYNYVEIKFNEEGTSLLSQISDPNLSSDAGTSFYNATISVWIDDRMIAYPTISEHFDSGAISFTNEEFTKSKAELFAAIIDSGAMPCDIGVVSFSNVDSISGNAPVKMILLVAFIALLLVAFITIYRYKVNGLITTLCMILQFSLILSFVTGFFANADAFVINIPAVCAWIFSVILTAVSCIMISEKIKQSVSGNTSLCGAVSSGFKAVRPVLFDINLVFLFISLVGILMFGASGFALSLFGNTLCGGIYGFSYVLLLGSLFNFVTGIILPMIFLKNIINFKFLGKSEMFGGKEK